MTDQGANQSGFAHAVAAHDPDRFAGAYQEIDIVKNMAGAIVRVQPFGLDDRASRHGCSSNPPRYARRTSAFARTSSGLPDARTLPLTMTVSTRAS